MVPGAVARSTVVGACTTRSALDLAPSRWRPLPVGYRRATLLLRSCRSQRERFGANPSALHALSGSRVDFDPAHIQGVRTCSASPTIPDQPRGIVAEPP